MKRTTIMASEDLLDRLHRIAREEHVSFAEVVRQGLELRVSQSRRRPHFIASGQATDPPFDAARKAADIEYHPDSWR